MTKPIENKFREKLIAEFLTDLYSLRASIPLTFGKDARKMAKEMIEKWEKF